MLWAPWVDCSASAPVLHTWPVQCMRCLPGAGPALSTWPTGRRSPARNRQRSLAWLARPPRMCKSARAVMAAWRKEWGRRRKIGTWDGAKVCQGVVVEREASRLTARCTISVVSSGCVLSSFPKPSNREVEGSCSLRASSGQGPRDRSKTFPVARGARCAD